MSKELVEKVRRVAHIVGARQDALAAFCEYSQGHISKVLAGQTNVSQRLSVRLELWLELAQPLTPPSEAEVAQLVESFSSVPLDRRVHVMHILRGLAALV